MIAREFETGMIGVARGASHDCDGTVGHATWGGRYALAGEKSVLGIVVPVKMGIQSFQRVTGFPVARERRNAKVLAIKGFSRTWCGLRRVMQQQRRRIYGY